MTSIFLYCISRVTIFQKIYIFFGLISIRLFIGLSVIVGKTMFKPIAFYTFFIKPKNAMDT